MRLALTCLATLVAASFVSGASPDPQVLADQLDKHIEARLKAGKVPAAPLAEDEELIRRVYLDLTGRIPAPREVYDFLADKSADKRAKLIDELLESPRYASHSAAVCGAALAPETTALPEAGVFRPGFEAWLRQRFRNNTPYDVIVRDLLTAPLSSDTNAPTPMLQKPEEPNPLAFFAVKEAKPENLAAAATRVFLGVQIECAQCHDHPFAKWTREQFWNQAAFFAGLERSGDGLFSPVSERLDTREIRMGDSKKSAAALFLDQRSPSVKKGVLLRSELSAWITHKENPYFARATVNRVWGQMFGRGIVDPVDDFHDENAPSHPELLDDLAKAFVAADFDLRYLIRAIGRTRAYQRTSARTDPKQDDPRLFARMAVRGLTGEQLFDTLVQATGYRQLSGRGSPRDQFLTRFAISGKPAEPETAIPQALALMNGRFIADLTALNTSPTLKVACELPDLTSAQRVELLYISALSRKPSRKEMARIQQHIDEVGTDRLSERLADVFWALLNSAEFRMNH